MIYFIIFYLLGVYILAVWFGCCQIEDEKLRIFLENEELNKLYWAIALSWFAVAIIFIEQIERPKLYWAALWPGNWGKPKHYILGGKIDGVLLLSYGLLVFIEALAMLINNVAMEIATGTAAVVITLFSWRLIPKIVYKGMVVLIMLCWLLGFPLQVSSQSIYKTYYSNPVNQHCAQITLRDTSITSSCFNLETFNKLATVWAPWCGPYDNQPWPVKHDVPIGLSAHIPTPAHAIPWDYNELVLWNIASLAPIEATVKGHAIMIEASQMPKIRVYLGYGPIYSFEPNGSEFRTDSRSERFPNLFGITVADVMSCLLDHLSVRNIVQSKIENHGKN